MSGLLDRGLELSRVGRHAEALATYDQLLSVKADDAAVLNNRGVTLADLQRNQEAIESLDRALKIKPEFGEAWCNRGVVLMRLGRLQDALQNFEYALKLNPGHAKALNIRGVVLSRLRRHEEALASYEAALAIQPADLDALANRGAVLLDLKRPDEALETADRALRISPDFVAAHNLESMVYLLKGNYGPGFRKYEWRWLHPEHRPAKRNFSQPLWIGQCNLRAKSILVHSEEGLGEVIQMMRYVPMIAALGAKVLLEIPRALAPMLAGWPGVDRFVLSGDPLPLTDFHCPILSLPLAFGTALETVPASIPYLPVDREAALKWRTRLSPGYEKLVGICWRGSPEYARDGERSIRFADFVSLLSVPGVRFVSLQKEITEGERRMVPDDRLVHPGVDMKSTAELVMGLDLIISVDTVWSHMAGAIGRPLWVLLPFVSHWVWLMDRDDSPWYPTARLFRQSKAGDWESVIRRVRAALVSDTPAGIKETVRQQRGIAAQATIGPGEIEVQNVLTLYSTRRFAEAEAGARQLIERWPGHGFGWKALGAVLFTARRLAEALPVLQKSIELLPLDAEVHHRLGATLSALGRLEEAEAIYRRTIEIDPRSHTAHNGLGIVLIEMQRLSEGEASYRRATELGADFGEAHVNLGNALAALRRYTEAKESFLRGLEIHPDWKEARSSFLSFLCYSGIETRARYLAQARDWEKFVIPPQARKLAAEKRFANPSRAGRRLRIGYVSGDFRDHPVSLFMAPLLKNHDRARIELFAYSTIDKQDETTRRLRRDVDHWHLLGGHSDEAAAALIAGHGIDILVDLSGHTRNNRLGVFALRAAPVQCHYLGYHASTGLSEMDYWIGDAKVTPECQKDQFCEETWRLPRVWMSYSLLHDAPEPVVQDIESGQIWIGSFNHLGKITESTVDLWSRILHEVPGTSLLLKSRELDDSGNRDRILREFGSRGIPGARIKCRGQTPDWTAHMSLYNELVISLDPIGGVTGGTTTCDALWMGTPVVTLAGNGYAERMTASMLTSIGREEWIATNEDEYVQKVSGLVLNPGLRKHLRKNLRDNVRQSPLSDTRGLARAMEDAFEGMFDRWLSRSAGNAG